ncbi:MAG TPA: type III-B CRISPR module RAMP protein Cmr6 [Haliangiales bacterium]|nr:type III-B CRISPR module RAMP protein Cmr6 [Haliangiales bacterium]
MIYACTDTIEAWMHYRSSHSRTLAADRFVDFPNNPQDKDWRRRTCEAIRTGKTLPQKADYWKTFLETLGIPPSLRLRGQLQSRLILNAAGGVLENGGLSLDRSSGLPFIAGSAAKGCARRYALIELSEAEQEQKCRILFHIAMAFGWCNQDWEDGRKRNARGEPTELISDFEWACGEGEPWKQLRDIAAAKLCEHFGWKTRADQPVWRQLPSFAGAVNFLPAFPSSGDPGIDLDVVTCHHKRYYGREEDSDGRLEMPVALDIEEPEPIVFPVVSAQKKAEFIFAVQPNQRGEFSLAGKARDWLKLGLERLGIGGKTNAGYGWFAFDRVSESAPAATATAVAGTATAQPTEHPLITAWKGKTSRENFRAFRPALAGIKEDADLRDVFEAIMPPNEMKNLRRSNTYWQSFTSHPEGQAIFKRLGLKLA